MDELETLNMLLRLIGSSPVNSSNTTHPDAANAKATMARVSKRVQRKGWWCNTDNNIVLEPDTDGFITVGKNVTSLVASNRNYILRGRKLYDKQNQTAIFHAAVVVNHLVYVLEWDDMPQVMQEVAAYSSAAEFVRDELEDPQKEMSLKEDVQRSYIDLNNQSMVEGQYNIFQKPRVARARGGVRPYAQSKVRFSGDPDA